MKPFAAFLAGKPVSLADYKGRTVVLEWPNFGCPFVQKHYRSGNMQDAKRTADPADVKLARNYVVAALDELKAGRPVSTPTTTPYGCTVKYR